MFALDFGESLFWWDVKDEKLITYESTGYTRKKAWISEPSVRVGTDQPRLDWIGPSLQRSLYEILRVLDLNIFEIIPIADLLCQIPNESQLGDFPVQQDLFQTLGHWYVLTCQRTTQKNSIGSLFSMN